MKKEVKIFLGGGVVLLEGDATTVGYRPSVVDPAISKLNSRRDTNRLYVVKTFSDLIHEYAPEGQQEHYYRYVEGEADIAIFIFDGNIGDRTKEEVERACNSNGKHSRPTIFFYGTNLNESDEIVSYLNSKNQYFQHFNNKEQLIHLIQVDLGMWREKSLLERLKYRRNLRKIEQQTKPTPSEIHSKEEERPIPKNKTYICPTICIFSFLCIFLARWLNGVIPSYIYLVLAFVWFVLFSGTIFNKRVLGVQKLWKGLLYLGLATLFCFIAFCISLDVEETNNEQPISTTEEVVEEEVLVDMPTAAQCYQQGKNYYYGNGVTQDYTEAVKWYRKAAEQGHANAQCCLGYCYKYGQGVSQDYVEAVKWYRKAVEQGNADAQNNLGVCYETGQGVSQDYVEAVKWYRKAAEQGNATAQNNLGYCYYYGRGVLEDKIEAEKWIRKAADQGFQPAKEFLQEYF